MHVELGPSPQDRTHELVGQVDPTHWINPEILMGISRFFECGKLSYLGFLVVAIFLFVYDC